MRIGFFTDSYFPEIDGVTYTIKTWKERLEERGHEVSVIYPASPEYDPGENEIPVRSLPNPFYSGYRIPIPLRTEIPELDIVHCHGPGPLGLKGRKYAHRNSLPSIYTHHTPLEEYFIQAVKSETVASLLGKVYVPLENRFIDSFDEFTASTGGAKRKPDHVQLPVGVDTEFFRPEDSQLLDSLDEPVAGYSGRISPEKNVGLLLEFAENFAGTVVIVGEGPKRDDLEQRAPGNVVFMDWLDREKLTGFYSSLEVFVTASTGDTLGLSTLEANACGTPVVAPDTHPFDETIGDGQGLLFQTGSSSDMAEKSEEVMGKSLETRKQVRKYSVDKTVDRLEDIYRRLEDGN